MGSHEIAVPRYEIVGNLERLDEADNVQARGEMIPDTDHWKEYYARHPEKEQRDREIFSLPRMGAVGARVDALMSASLLSTVNGMGRNTDVDGIPSKKKIQIDPARASEKIKGFARLLGADLVRIGPLNPAWVYSHIGRVHYEDQVRGTPIHLPHPYAISVAVALPQAMLKTGPVLPSIIGTMSVYLQLAKIVSALAHYIRRLGYSARAHQLRNYQVLCIPIAVDAGMGELSRIGVMITKEHGPAVKIATVTTDLPMELDRPVNIGVREFCEKCKICADNCPSHAITKGKPEGVRGVRKWRISPEACYRYWNETGTDCGICLASCPWTKPRNWFHALGREMATRGGMWVDLMLLVERLFYGRTFKPAHGPSWMETPSDEWKKIVKIKNA